MRSGLAPAAPAMLRRLGVVALAAVLGCQAFQVQSQPLAPPATLASERAQAQAFWTRFRAAVEKEDWLAVADMAAQPLVVRGTTDGAPARKVSGKEAPAVLRQQLKQTAYDGKGRPTRSLIEWVQETPELADRHWIAHDQIRFQNLAFRKSIAGWKLVLIYDEES
jgi:hypothetical protein